MVSHLKSSSSSSSSGRTPLGVSLAIFLVLLLGALVATRPGDVSDITLAPPQAQTPEPVTLVMVGDIMFDRGVRASVEKNLAGDYHRLYEHASYLARADIAFGNLEGPVATGGRNVGSRFSFRMDPVGLLAMQSAGFDVVSFANNHVGDYTLAALTETLDRLRESGVLAAGAGRNRDEAASVQVIDVRDTTVGFIAASDVGPAWAEASDTREGILLADDTNFSSIIAEADAQVDVLVVSFHWGDEYSPVNSRQEKLAKAAIDAGADVVVGHHPHVMERVEAYQGKPIFYSLGNYIFDQYFSPHTMRGMVAFVSIDPKTNELTWNVQVSPISSQYVPQPLVDFDESMLVTKTFTP